MRGFLICIKNSHTNFFKSPCLKRIKNYKLIIKSDRKLFQTPMLFFRTTANDQLVFAATVNHHLPTVVTNFFKTSYKRIKCSIGAALQVWRNGQMRQIGGETRSGIYCLR